MRSPLPLVVLSWLALGLGGASRAQLADPIPAPVEKRGLAVEIRDVVRLPDTRGLRPRDQDVTPAGWARVSYVRDLPDGRRFVNDSRGFLYLLGRDNQPTLYADVAAASRCAVYNRLESGFIGFTFHPEFARNGLFYTVHGERGAGQSGDAELHSARLHAERRHVSQRHHRVARDQPRGRHVRRARGASCCASRTSSQNLTHPLRRRRVQPDGEAGSTRITACSTPAAATSGSATAAARTRTTRARPSGSTRS